MRSCLHSYLNLIWQQHPQEHTQSQLPTADGDVASSPPPVQQVDDYDTTGDTAAVSDDTQFSGDSPETVDRPK